MAFPEKLKSGYHAFKSGRFVSEEKQYSKLALEGQAPEILLISCCDSRAAPEVIFNTGPGELFIVRNVANLVPAFEASSENTSVSAAIEFAVNGLKVNHIAVMGHARCGGIKAALGPASDPLSPDNFVGKWIAPLAPLARLVNDDPDLADTDKQKALELRSVVQSLENLRSFPFIAQKEQAGELVLHGLWFDIETADLTELNKVSGEFHPL